MIAYDLILKRKTGFRNKLPNVPVIIFDERGIEFYNTGYLEDYVMQFNLPAGKYIVMSGRIDQLHDPVDYSKEMLPLPKPERRGKPNTNYFDVRVGDVPAKCVIDWNNETITFDRSLCDEPLPRLRFILEHENGHRYYSSEDLCDRYAHNQMLEAGYNPSQIGLGVIGTFSRKNRWREEKLINDMTRDSYDECDCSQDSIFGSEFGGTATSTPTKSNEGVIQLSSTPNKDWSCGNWIMWHKAWVAGYQDGTLAKFSKQKAIDEANKIFHYWWNEVNAGGWFFKTCSYNPDFVSYFKSVGYTQHISSLGAIVSTAVGGSAEIVTDVGDVTKNLSGFLKTLSDNLMIIAIVVIILILSNR